MDTTPQISIEPMTEAQLEEAVQLVAVSMNDDEANWARQTMKLYFACRKLAVDSGRDYYVWQHNGKIYGLVGLHRYIWGPKENVWLSWFAVHPEQQGKGAGSLLIDSIKEQAIKAGHKNLFVETYDNQTFYKAHLFYKAKGFREMGRIQNYLPDGSAMVIFGMRIA